LLDSSPYNLTLTLCHCLQFTCSVNSVR